MGRFAISRHDSPLGRWTRTLYVPGPPLARHVEMFWHVSGRALFARDRRLPTGNAHLLFNLGAPPTLFGRSPGEAGRSFQTCWFAGQSGTYIETGSHGATVLLGVQFRSAGAFALLRVAQHELSDEVVEVEALLGDVVLRVRERLLDAATPQACFAVLEQWLLGLLDRGAEVHPAVDFACGSIARAHGAIDLHALSRRTGFSRGHLIRRFRAEVGLTPKTYASVHRFQRAIELARRPNSSWADVATTCGYYDQAHLIRDFRRFAGRAPSSLLADRQPDRDSIVID